MSVKKINDDAWKDINEAILYWIQALPLGSPLNDLTKAYRFQAKYHYNQSNIRTAIRLLNVILDLEKKYKTGLFTDNDKKLIQKWGQELR